jgi:ABC-type lipoprotein export system ATPase subunit
MVVETTSEAVVEMRGVRRSYASRSGPVVALDDIDVAAGRGRLTVIAGASGSGKSTLLAIAACIDRPDDGAVHVAGHDVTLLGRRAHRSLRRRLLGLMLPVPADNLLSGRSALENLRWSARRREPPIRGHDRFAEALEQVGLIDALDKRVAALSGGEQQRLALVIAMLGDPAVVLADEPTATLDRSSGALVVAALRDAADAGTTLVVTTHDHELIEAADAIVVLDHGRRVR